MAEQEQQPEQKSTAQKGKGKQSEYVTVIFQSNKAESPNGGPRKAYSQIANTEENQGLIESYKRKAQKEDPLRRVVEVRYE